MVKEKLWSERNETSAYSTFWRDISFYNENKTEKKEKNAEEVDNQKWKGTSLQTGLKCYV